MKAYISTGCEVRTLHEGPGMGVRGAPLPDVRLMRQMKQGDDAPRFLSIEYDDAETAKRRANYMRRAMDCLDGYPVCVAYRDRIVILCRGEDDGYER